MLEHGSAEAAVHLLAQGIGLVGVAVVLWGVLRSAISLLVGEARQLLRSVPEPARDGLRHHLGSYLLLALEFLVAADIVETFLEPTPEHLVALGGLVVLRTVISYTLSWELGRGRARAMEAEE